jgi:hypothetical protein
MAIMDKLPEVPRLKKFCFCMDVPTGVKASSFLLSGLWVIVVLAVFFGGEGVANLVWSIVWGLLHIAAYSAAIYGQIKGKKDFLQLALIIMVIFLLIDIIQGIIQFVLLNWYAGAVIVAQAALSVYYMIGLKNVSDDITGSGLPSLGGLFGGKPSTGGLPGTAAPVLDVPGTASGPSTDPEAPEIIV